MPRPRYNRLNSPGGFLDCFSEGSFFLKIFLFLVVLLVDPPAPPPFWVCSSDKTTTSASVVDMLLFFRCHLHPKALFTFDLFLNGCGQKVYFESGDGHAVEAVGEKCWNPKAFQWRPIPAPSVQHVLANPWQHYHYQHHWHHCKHCHCPVHPSEVHRLRHVQANTLV